MAKKPYPAIPNDAPDCQILHYVPQNDLREHDTNKRDNCWCRPDVEEEGPGYVVVHKALDGRELFEDGRRLPS